MVGESNNSGISRAFHPGVRESGADGSSPRAVSATYLQAAYERMRLPVRIECTRASGEGTFVIHFPDGDEDARWYTYRRADAVRAYLDLCTELLSPTPSPAQLAGAES